MRNASPTGPALSTDCSDLDQRRNTVCAQTPATHHTSDPLAEPVEIAKFWKNRRGEAVRVELRTFKGRTLVDVRQMFTSADGHLSPTKKGLCLSVRHLPQLAAALAKAERKARELGLLGEEATS